MDKSAAWDELKKTLHTSMLMQMGVGAEFKSMAIQGVIEHMEWMEAGSPETMADLKGVVNA